MNIADTLLDNGLRVLAARRPSTPVVHLRLGVPFGATGDPAVHAATAELLGATLLGGTGIRDRAGVEDALADAGGSLRVNMRPERLKVAGQVLADGLTEVLGVLTEALTGATFPEPDLTTERARLLGQVRLAGTLPHYLARTALVRHLYGDHPAAHEVPDATALAAVDRDAVRALRDSHLVPGGAVLVLAGDLDPARAVAEVTRFLGDWHGAHAAHRMPAPPPIPAGPVGFVPRDGARQATVRLAGPGLPRTDPGFPALQLASHVFGGYFSARLVRELRERRGWIYAGASTVEEQAGTGTVHVQFGAAPEHCWAAVDEALTLLDVPPTDDEIAAARGHCAGVQAISLSTQEGLVEGLYGAAVGGLGHEWLTGYRERLAGVPDDAVRAAAATWLRPDGYTGVLVGPAQPALRAASTASTARDATPSLR
jgi:zinc protease